MERPIATAVPGAAPATPTTGGKPSLALPDLGIVGLVRVLVLLQGAFALVSALEVAFFGLLLASPALLPSVAATGGVAVLTLALPAGLRRRSRLARRVTLAVEVLVLLVALVDLGLSLALAHTFLDPMPALTRLAIPAAVVVLLRRPSVRAEFGVRAPRRQRRSS